MQEGTLAQPTDPLLRVLWHPSPELHYVTHFCEPLDVKVGDIGYVTRFPSLHFVHLANVYHKLADGYPVANKVLRHCGYPLVGGLAI
jgi:hypothetical protein